MGIDRAYFTETKEWPDTRNTGLEAARVQEKAAPQDHVEENGIWGEAWVGKGLEDGQRAVEK
jgi:hypothetical protein